MLLTTIDVGTNSVKLLVARVRPPRIRTLLEKVVVTRLGEGVARNGVIGRGPAERTFLQLAFFRELLQPYPVEKALLVGTRVFRAAGNGRELLRQWNRSLDIRTRLLSGREEARLAHLGACPGARPATAVDIGGGSTEISLGRGGILSRARSVDIGAVTLTEEELEGDPPTEKEVERARLKIREGLKRTPGIEGELVGVGGTIATAMGVARGLNPSPENVHGKRLSREEISRLLRRLLPMPLEKRLRVRGLAPGRADILPAGLLILEEIMTKSGRESIRVSSRGLRHGLALDLASR